jgi:[ribosomal protein S18]-alanine N-acetyltransferase
MRVSFREMSAEEAEAVASWRYDDPYAFYDADADADDLALLLSPETRENRYFSAVDDHGTLVGFFEFKGGGSKSLELGLGLRPDLTGRGHGLGFLEAGMAFARARFAPAEFRLSVVTFNERAIRVYERAQFRPVREYDHETAGGVHRFLEMARPAE